MTRKSDGRLLSPHPLTQLVKSRGVESWSEAVQFIHDLPYGRNTSKSDLSLVVREERGTCSSKHAFLKALADENGMTEVALVLCIYLMTEKNTPGISPVLTENGLAEIPEAHCYLHVGDQPLDVTGPGSHIHHIGSAVIHEEIIRPDQIGNYKVQKHREVLQKWLLSSRLDMTLESLWNIRENCINQLSVSRSD